MTRVGRPDGLPTVSGQAISQASRSRLPSSPERTSERAAAGTKHNTRLPPYYQDELVTIYHGDARDVLASLPDASVDLIFTDPPYLRAYDHVWDILAEGAARLLKDGASLLTYLGHYQLGRVMEAMTASGLRYNWLCIQRNHGPKPTMFGARALVSFKPILWYTQGPIARGTGGMMQDDLTFPLQRQRDVKVLHEWGQPVSTLPILRLASEGDVVLDPFAGSGTTLLAAKECGRRAIGIEIEERYCEIAATRCSQEVLGLSA